MKKLFSRAAKNQDGYALVEIIMAIGILAVVGLYVIEMFVLAGTMQSKAQDLDSACLLAQTAVEDARAGDAFIGDKHYNDKWVEVSDRREDGFTLSAVLLEESPRRYKVSVFKNGKYVYFTGGDAKAGEEIYSLGITLYEEGEAG